VALFVDTVYWFALMNPNDAWHRHALEWAARISEPLVTTDAVLTEVADAFCRADRRRWAVEVIRTVQGDPEITSVPGSADLFTRALDLYGSRPDKDWSLTDCISFVVMKDQGLQHALTADLHFVQAGFQALLRR
jgi:hypothetical protein